MIDAQRLATAILRQALIDARSRSHPVAQRQAEVWLTTPGNRDRQFWVHVAGLRDDVVTEQTRRVLQVVDAHSDALAVRNQRTR